MEEYEVNMLPIENNKCKDRISFGIYNSVGDVSIDKG
jgi:hypothetical protein